MDLADQQALAACTLAACGTTVAFYPLSFLLPSPSLPLPLQFHEPTRRRHSLTDRLYLCALPTAPRTPTTARKGGRDVVFRGLGRRRSLGDSKCKLSCDSTFDCCVAFARLEQIPLLSNDGALACQWTTRTNMTIRAWTCRRGLCSMPSQHISILGTRLDRSKRLSR